jgi:Lon protease-like protein
MNDIALFPLGTVLYPGGLLPLRIFETRYVDMVGRSMRESVPFGVVHIESGHEVGEAVKTAATGTTARIVDFQALEDGLLGLLCRGESRFRIVTPGRQPDGLNRAEVEWLAEPPVVAVASEYAPLVKVLRSALSRMAKLGRTVEPSYDDATWVGYRLAELLPLPPALQQQLLELNDPNERLKQLASMIDTNQ